MNTKNFQAFTQILQYIIKYFKWIVVFATVLIVLSGVYRVQGNEEAVVLRFGRITGTPEKQIKKPGLHFALPFFIDEVIKIPVHTIHERDITTHYGTEDGSINKDVEKNGYLLTGDNNVVLISVKIKYQIKEPVQYIFSTSDAGKTIDGVVSAEMTRTITHMDIDSVLTSGRAELSVILLNNSQLIIDELKLGVLITGVELTGIVPPAETIRYFEAVRDAAVVKQTGIQQALERSSIQILSAQGEASAAKQRAISEQNTKLIRARDEMAEFYGLYGQYARNPQIIMAGTFRQRAAAVFAKTGASIIVPNGSSAPVIVLP
ncbi:MAG: protease modulator HflK [Treponema sp.]|jgi:membrane protease subunit HflK|nr:protease modulator HflK [Treponema sp.]